ncbi:beta-lactamase-like protein [Gamsiella multidivaricata]|uniref:beta-lactamase-like protein n=1 Tax=Gamsiella multidivaricata TaxID=101098 RepID=UPI00221E66E7|nr:beta-lactamase-like protein [Gamsiella multidivaricata]KAI7817042.1 beta-lactamase-like protein [Gamsiella multidivaricata]
MTQSSPDANSFPDLVELDALRLTVIVDNEVDFMSSCPRELNHTTQAQTLFKDKRNIDKERSTVESDTNAGGHHGHSSHAHDHHGHPSHTHGSDSAFRTVNFHFQDVCCGAHGLSILLTGTKDNVEHRVLFDTGPHSAIFLENAKRLEVEFEKIEVIVLSHWHIDHSGGMLTAVDKIQEARSKGQGLAPVVVDLHPDRPDERGIRLTRPSGSHEQPDVFDYVAWGKDPSFKELEDAGAKVSQSSQAHTVCDGFFGVSGVIPRMTAYETGLPNHARWSVETKLWKQEQEIMDERYLVARVKSKGIVVLTGCSHAGVINVCQDVKRAFQHGKGAGNNDLHFVVGGFHLAGLSMETRIKETVSDMLDLNPSFMAPGHCSGWRAKAALEQAMPGKVVSLGVGSDFLINHHGS